MASSLSLLLGLVLSFAFAASAARPFFAWSSSQRGFSSYTTSPTKTVTVGDIRAKSLELSSKCDKIVVFLQEGFSLNTVTKYANVYSDECMAPLSFLKKSISAAEEKLLVPKVSGSLQSFLADLGMNQTSISLSAQELVSADKDALAAAKVVIISLPSLSGSDDSVKAALKDSDEVMESLLSEGSCAILSAEESDFKPIVANVQRRNTVEAKRNVVGGTIALTPAKAYLYFTPPIFMGILVLFFVVIVLLIGVYCLFVTPSPDQFADPSDKPLDVANKI